MSSHILVIDTETTGLPKKWDRPYSDTDNWPSAIQISWLIFTQDGLLVKEQNYYISDDDRIITQGAFRVHGLTKTFLTENGISRNEVLHILSDDILQYNPLIVGHCTELDFHVLGATYQQRNITNPLLPQHIFCTMLATKSLVRNPSVRFLKLGELYEELFNKPLLHQHNAIVDARATAECFFALLERNIVTEQGIEAQVQPLPPVANRHGKKGFALGIALVFLIIIVVALFYGK